MMCEGCCILIVSVVIFAFWLHNKLRITQNIADKDTVGAQCSSFTELALWNKHCVIKSTAIIIYAKRFQPVDRHNVIKKKFARITHLFLNRPRFFVFENYIERMEPFIWKGNTPYFFLFLIYWWCQL